MKLALPTCFYRFIFLLAIAFAAGMPVKAQQRIRPGAESIGLYLPQLKGKRVAVLVNQASRVGGQLLPDTLLKCGVRIVKIFVPEHGLRGVADAGAHVSNDKDSATGLPVLSLYGNNKKPSAAMLQDVDVVVYDLQDVGVRFYTYISTLQYVMEACAEQHKHLLLLDRPNPNGNYVDGPVLDTAFRSFVGMQPIPVVYGMTPGEYALMLQGEKWFARAGQLDISVIPCKNYTHHSKYALPVAPSPNLKRMEAIYLYASLCFFEGTNVSMGRGTDKPFQQWGSPAFAGMAPDSFRPVSTVGATHPPYEGQTCYGRVLNENDVKAAGTALQLKWLVEAYKWQKDKSTFFNSFFEKLAGTDVLRAQIITGLTAEQIQASWQPGLERFKKIRKEYLLYAN